MKEVKIDFIENTITVTKKFYEESKEHGTEAYRKMQTIIAENPNMKISVQAPRRTGKNAYKGLTYRYMRKFISVMDPDNMKTFEEVQLLYEGLYGDSLSVYNAVREWFLDNYPNHKDMIVEAVPQRVTLKIA